VKGNGLVYGESAGLVKISVVPAATSKNLGPGGYRLDSLTAGGVATDLGATGTLFSGATFSYLVPVELVSFIVD
jgi:hypothetical protein